MRGRIMTHYQDYGFKGYIKNRIGIEDIGKALYVGIWAD